MLEQRDVNGVLLGESRDLPPGFCPECPDLSVRVWRTGRVEVLSNHRSKLDYSQNSVVLVVLSKNFSRFGLSVAELVCAAFAGVAFTQIESVDHWDDDPYNCSIENLEPVCMDEPCTGKRSAAIVPEQGADDYKDLLPGFFAAVPDLSLRVWRSGKWEVLSEHESGWNVTKGGLVAVICKKPMGCSTIPVAKLVVAAFAGVPLERIRRVSMKKRDWPDYSYENLIPVFFKKK
jgi:hypothetical protein